MKKTLCTLFLSLFGIASVQAEPPTAIAIRNARVVTVSGPVLANGTVLMRNGLIEAVGENIVVPADAWVIDGQGLTVYPGLIDAISTIALPESLATPSAGAAGRGGRTGPAVSSLAAPGIAPPPARGPEDRPLTTSWVVAADQLQAGDARVGSARDSGYTTAVVFPNRGIFAGQGSVIDLAGEKPGQMVVQSPAGMYTTLQTNGFTAYPGSLMGVIAYIRQVMLDADYYRAAKARYRQHPAGEQRPEYDRALEGVLAAPRFLMPAMQAYEMDRMTRFAQELHMKAVLYGAHEGYRAVDVVKRAGVPVLVSLKWPEAPRDANPDDVEALRVLRIHENAPKTPVEFAKAQVKFGFYTDGLTSLADVRKAVRRSLDAGLSPADAIRAMTLSVAEIYGVNDRLGSIAKGKIANLVVTKGDLFDEKSKVQYVFVDGVKYEPTEETAPGGQNGRGVTQ